MSRYIDADKLWDDISKRLIVKDRDPIIRTVGIVIKKHIEAQPTADVVEVVRCKDCKHYDGGFCLIWDKCIIDDGYCYESEREEE